MSHVSLAPAFNSHVVVVRFPEVHEAAELQVAFQRTLRAPDAIDGREAGTGLSRYQPFARHAGTARKEPRYDDLVIPMFQAEAMSVEFLGRQERGIPYPFLVRAALSGQDVAQPVTWGKGPKPPLSPDHALDKNYFAFPRDYWIDGVRGADGITRQFVAPSVKDEHGAVRTVPIASDIIPLTFVIHPMKPQAFTEILQRYRAIRTMVRSLSLGMPRGHVGADISRTSSEAQRALSLNRRDVVTSLASVTLDMWDVTRTETFTISLANALSWKLITGQKIPHLPQTSKVRVQKVARALNPSIDEHLLADEAIRLARPSKAHPVTKGVLKSTM